MTRLAISSFVLSLATLLLLVPLFQGPAAADRGGIPMGYLHYSEEAQNAIAAWNGREEVLILSTDLRADKSGKLLEMLPLPSAPSSISRGDRRQFDTFIELFNLKAKDRPPVSNDGARSAEPAGNASVQILFQQSIGAHNLTAAKVTSCDHFAEWVKGFAAESGVEDYSIGSRMNLSVEDHLKRGICFFVFDVVEIGPKLRSQDPIIYRFNTTSLYYPVAITAASGDNNGRGYPAVNLFLLVDGQIDQGSTKFHGLRQGKGFEESIRFTSSELGRVSGDIRSLFKGGAQAAYMYSSGAVLNDQTWTAFLDVAILKSQVRWSAASSYWQEPEVHVESGQVPVLTFSFSTLIVAIVMTGGIFRLRKYW